MNVPTPPLPAHQSEGVNILREAIVVAIVGIIVAFVSNSISPRGLNLARNYFPEIKSTPTPAVATTNATTPTETQTNAAAPEAESAVARLKAKGLQVVDFDEVKKLLRDPGIQQGSIIFIDARGEDEYQAGHIPGAYPFDYYHNPDKYLATLVPAFQSATKIVVYCHGGDCEDSELTALYLRDGGVPNEKLFVYAGGMAEWDADGAPLETGARNSGKMLPATK